MRRRRREDGQRADEARRYYGLSLTADSGSLVAARQQILSSIWVAPEGDAARAAPITSPNNNYEGHDEVDITPDGKRIVYYSRAGGGEDIWVMNADGTGQRQLTFEGDANYDCTICADGRHIVFASERGGRQNVWRMDVDGGNLKQLTDGGSDTNPFCTSDGRWVFFENGYGLWKVPFDGGEPVRVLEGMTEDPVVSPDGKYVVCEYRERADAPWRVAVLSSDTGQPVKFFDPSQDGQDREYRFTPDSRSITFVETENGVSNIWSRPLDGGPPRQLTDFKTEQIFNYSWTRDGRWLVVVRGTATSDVVMISGFR